MVMQLERQKHNYLKNGAFLVQIKKSFEVKESFGKESFSSGGKIKLRFE